MKTFKEFIGEGLTPAMTDQFFNPQLKERLKKIFIKEVEDFRINPDTKYFEIKRTDIDKGKWLKSKIKWTKNISFNDLVDKIKFNKKFKNIMR